MAEEGTKNLVKPKDLAIYDRPKAVTTLIKSDITEEYPVATETIKNCRIAINDGWRQLLYAKEQVDHIVATGKAHTESTVSMIKDEIEMLRDEENVPMRVGFIAGGGLLGLVTSAIRRKKWFGKSIYTLIGAGLFTAILYPDDTYQFGKDLSDEGQKLGKIAVNFVQGVQPDDVKESKSK